MRNIEQTIEQRVISFEYFGSFIREMEAVCRPYHRMLCAKKKKCMYNVDSTSALNCLFSVNKYSYDTLKMEALYAEIKCFL